MSQRILDQLKAKLNYIPTCLEYANLLNFASKEKGINTEKLRDKMGTATYAQWAKFLNIA